MEIPIAVGVLFIVMGVLAMAAAAEVIFRARKEAAGALSTTGVVVAMRAVAGRRGYIYCPVVQFRGPSGELVTIESSIGGQPPRHAVGQQVAIFHPPGRPEKAELEAPAVLWLIPAGFVVVGLFFAAAGALMVLVFGLAAASG